MKVNSTNQSFWRHNRSYANLADFAPQSTSETRCGQVYRRQGRKRAVLANGKSRNQSDRTEQVIQEIKSRRKLQDLVLGSGGRELAEQIADTMARRLEHPQT